ncbi:MAG: hypothetical protein RR945_01795 [Erysipelotrichaceae bacterium]
MSEVKSKKYTLFLDEEKIDAIAVSNPNWQDELNKHCEQGVERMYKKYVKSSVREFIENMKKSKSKKE